MKPKQKVVLVILDGWGLYKEYPGNAVALAKTPHFDHLWEKYGNAVLTCDGESIGLPEGQVGTSEVNHFTIGAGTVVFQDLVRINRSIADESFFANDALVGACQWAKNHRSRLHIMGLVSDGGVHSHEEHLYALLDMARREGVSEVLLHVFTDGRDTRPTSSIKSIRRLEEKIADQHLGKIVSIVGRYFSMDRDHNWDRTDKAFNLLTKAQGTPASSPQAGITASHQTDLTDEFIEPIWLGDKDDVLKANDALIFANFRTDRVRQLTERILDQGPKPIYFATMTKYNPAYNVEVAFPLVSIETTLGEVLANAGLKQLRVTETEKFPHMTFFFNCKREEPYEGEDRIMLDSYSDVKTHDQKPQMRASEIADQIIEAVQNGSHDVILANICNADMVGHSGIVEAGIKACEAADKALGRIAEATLKAGYALLVTADHGNADMMIDEETGGPHTSHTNNPVPFIVVDKKCEKLARTSGTLIDIAPTILAILGVSKPSAMTGESLLGE